MPDKHIEIEVKFWVEDLKPVRDRLVELGAMPVGERVLETNLRLDRPDRSLSQNQQALRLRWTSPALAPGPSPTRGEGSGGHTCRLTYKALATEEGHPSSVLRPTSRQEIEVEVSDLEEMSTILQGLGFETVFIYEKYRETFHLAGTEVALDELPYGCFVEIEGERGDIERAATQLGLRPTQHVPGTYLTLFEAIQRRLGLPFRDLTFDNFRGLRVTPEDLELSFPSSPTKGEGGGEVH